MQQSRISKFFQTKPKTVPTISTVSNSNGINTGGITTIDLTEGDDNESSVDYSAKIEKTKGNPSVISLAARVQADSFISDPMKHNKLQRLIFSATTDDMENSPVEQSPSSSSGKATFTPLEKQVIALRQKFPDSLLMVECGYRMRFFGPDAVAASRVLSIFAHQDHNFMVASVPTHRAFVHCQRLLTAGYKVAIVRQTETAAIRKSNKARASSSSTFERSVVGVFTEGTFIDSDDPAFEGLQKMYNSSNVSNTDQDESDGNDDNDDHGDLLLNDDSAGIGSDDIWVASVYESATESHFNEGITAIAAINIRAHQVWIASIETDRLRQGMKDHLDIIKPSEVIISDNCTSLTEKCIHERLANTSSNCGIGYIKRLKVLPSTNFSQDIPDMGFQCGKWVEGLAIPTKRAITGLFLYLSEFGLQQSLNNPELVESSSAAGQETQKLIIDLPSKNSFALDGVTIRDLEVFDSLGNAFGKLKKLGAQAQASNGSNNKTRRASGGLFGLIDNCRSAYGRRMLKSWLMHPLLTREEIISRHEAIDWMNSSTSNQTVGFASNCRQAFIEIISSFPEAESVLTSLQFNRISPPRMIRLLNFANKLSSLHFPSSQSHLQQLPMLLRQWLHSANVAQITKQATFFLDYLFISSSDEDSHPRTGLSGIFTVAAEQSMEELHTLHQEREAVLTQLNDELLRIRKELHRPQLSFTTLRTGALSQIEHLIELPLKDENVISTTDGHWVKVSSTKQVVRFHNRTILKIQDELYRIRDEVKIASQVAWRLFCEKVKASLYESLRTVIHILGNIDAILSLATVAQYPNYCKPLYPENSQNMIIRQGRHPMLERIVEDEGNMFLPNDVNLSQQHQKRSCQIVTGPNMGGKSSYVRMIGLIALLGQIGSYVPAEYASLCVFDNIFTRMGVEDDISSGKSTFMCELIRTNKILQESSQRSLVIIDELGRGTATNDGQAIAEATLDYIIHHIGCATLFITHFQHIANLVETAVYGDKAFNSHMSYVENINENGEKDIIFLYKSVEKPSQGSHGLNVARLAGIPSHVLKRAVEMSKWIENQDSLKRIHSLSSSK